MLIRLFHKIFFSPLAERNDLSDVGIFGERPQDSRYDIEDVSKALDLLSKNLRVTRSKMRLADDLGHLAGQAMVSPKLDNLSDELYQLAKNQTQRNLVSKIETVDDLATFLAVVRP